MVDKNLSGFSNNFNAFCAPFFPCLAFVSSFNFRDETKANSDMESKPLNKINNNIISISIYKDNMLQIKGIKYFINQITRVVIVIVVHLNIMIDSPAKLALF